MICESCGNECPRLTQKSFNGPKECDKCLTWKGARPPESAKGPVFKNILR